MASVPLGKSSVPWRSPSLSLGLAAADDLEGLAGVRVDRLDVGVQRDHHDVVERLVVLPVRGQRALDGQVACALELQRDAAAVDREVERAVGAGVGHAELVVVEHGHAHALDRRAVAGLHLAAQDGDLLGVDRARLDVALDRVRAAEEELRRVIDRGRGARIERRRGVLRVGRDRVRRRARIARAGRRSSARAGGSRCRAPGSTAGAAGVLGAGAGALGVAGGVARRVTFTSPPAVHFVPEHAVSL